MRRRHLLRAAALAPFAPRLATAEASKTLNFVPYADVAAVDPIWSSTYATRTHALAVFDTLYGTDEALAVQPQMVEGHVTENDGRLWRLTLREGLVFHDGQKVLARDCTASLERWGKRDAFGQSLMDATDELSAPDDRTILFRLKRRFPLLTEALGRASSLVPVIMPERLARTDPFRQVPEVIGSGPFRYLPGERVPAARVVYEKHAAYRPREGRPSFTAGARAAYLDRIVFNVMPDPAAAAAALQAGEVDWIEQPMIDLLPLLRRHRDIVVEVKDPTGMVGQMRFNHLHPPFSNAAIRRIVLAAVSQQDCMTAVAGSEGALWRDGVGAFLPGAPMANDAGLPRPPRDVAALRRALDAAGYGGERVVFLAAAEVPRIAAVCEVTRDVLVQLGLNVDFVQADWGTIGARTTSKETVDRGGWSCYCTYVSGLDMMTPATHAGLRANGPRAAAGWPDSPAIEALRARWFAASDLAAQRALCRELQLQAWQDVPFVPLGLFTQPVAYRRSLTGMLRGVPVFTNLRKA